MYVCMCSTLVYIICYIYINLYIYVQKDPHYIYMYNYVYIKSNQCTHIYLCTYIRLRWVSSAKI